MQLPITDKFLWNIYNFIENLDTSFDLFAPRTMREAVCPDLLRLRRKLGRAEDRRNFSKALSYLKKKGIIRVKNLQGIPGVIVTSKGIDKIFKIKLKSTERKRRTDGKWVMMIFDIPERKRILRDILRENLVLLGYEKLQQSVWVSPYDVLKETEGVVRRYELDSYVRVFLINEIET